MATPLNPQGMSAPFSNYSHALVVPAGSELFVCSGQLGMRPDGTIPADTAGQARICFENIRTLLEAGGMGLADVIRLNAYVTAREHMAPYMEVRNALFAPPYPASTLMIVGGFTLPEFHVEIEAIAARRP